MNPLQRALREFLAARPPETAIALVGGIAVSVRTEPRFTRDLDFAVAVADDSEVDAYVFRLRQVGYETATVLQHASDRIATVRLKRSARSPFVDLLFQTAGIEREIVEDSRPLDVGGGVITSVARVGHLVALKLLSRDDDTRPSDRGDLVALAKVADADEWTRAERAVEQIHERGFARGRDLHAALASWRERASH